MHSPDQAVFPVGRYERLARCAWLCVLFLSLPAMAVAAPPDATDGSYIDTTYTYNLGPTGARGWIYNTGNDWAFVPEGLTYESRQILVTTVDAGSPADGKLQANDVILGIGSTLFTNDARKAFGLALGEAEKTVNAGQLRLKVWRSGITYDNVTITLPVLGSYSDTAPYNCPKSALILSNACTYMAARSISGSTEGNAVIGLALLASGRTNLLPKVQAYARSVAAGVGTLTVPLNEMCAWPWGYNNTFLSEYYLATGDTNVLHAISEYTITSAKGQSWCGLYGHGMAWPKPDGSSTHGIVPPYGALNQAGLLVAIGIILGDKCGITDPEIAGAIERPRRYFGSFAGKGAVPYGQDPAEELHDDNGKNGEAALLLALQTQADMSPQVQYFAKSCTAAYAVRNFGHCGPFWAQLWQPLAANLGGTNAMAAHFKEIAWELDLSRRPNGSFVYHQSTGNTAGTTDALGTDSDTAKVMLTYATALKKIYLTGKNSSPNNWLSPNEVSEAIADGVGTLPLDMKTWTTNELVNALSSWSAHKRRLAVEELVTRTSVTASLVPGLMVMAEGTNACLRMGATKALTMIQDTRALPVLARRLNDSDYYVRWLAVGGYSDSARFLWKAAAQPILTNMLSIIISNELPIQSTNWIESVNWIDPCQVAQTYLGYAVFGGQLKDSVAGVSTNLLYPAIGAISRGAGRGGLAGFFNGSALLTNHVAALAPLLTTTLMAGFDIPDFGVPNAIVNLLSKYYYDEGIAAAMLFPRVVFNRARLDANTCLNALQRYRSAAKSTLPELYYWNSNCPPPPYEGLSNGQLSPTIAVIENDISAPPPLLYFKKVTSASATPTVLHLPAATTALHAAGTDLDGGVLAYTWSKFQGPGPVTFSTNSTAVSSNCVATFTTPGAYIVRGAVADSTLGDGTHCYGAVFTNLPITVLNSTNLAPVSLNRSLTTAVNTPTDITLAATDANSDPLTYSIVTQPAHGTLSGTVPAVTYTPANGYTGADSFTFKANDGTADSSVATVMIDVGVAGNRRPVANNQVVSTVEDTAQALTLTGSDPDSNPLTYTTVSSPVNGTLSGTPPSVTYTPATNCPAGNFSGADSFTFVVSDGSLTSAAATVSITVTPVNDVPAADPQTLVMTEDTVRAITLTGTDPENYPLTYSITALPAKGAISGAAPNLTYTPPTNYFGVNTLTFTVTDVEGLVSPVATVSLTVTNVNDAPAALDRSLPVTNNTATAILLTGTDVEGDALTYTVLTQPTHGTLAGSAPNVTYTPATNYNSVDSFTFKVNDGKVDSANIATVNLSVGSVFAGIYSEFYQNPPNLYAWPDMAHLVPDDTRIDTQISISHANFPATYEDHFSSRHTAYLKITTAGNYTFTTSADDNTRVYVDETWVSQAIYGQAGWNLGPRYLTPGYHGIRVEFVETYGDNYLYLNWSGPAGSGTIPASVFFRCVGSTAPVSPANLTATPLDSAVALAWSASPFATSYTLKRSLTPGGPYTAVPDVLTTTSYRDTSVTNGTPYYYVVTATGSGGTGFDSVEAGATPVAAPVTVNLDYHGSSILMNGTASYSAADRGTASRVAPLDYDGVNASAADVNFWNAGSGGSAALANLKNSEGVATPIGVSALLVSHGSASDWGGLGVAPNGAKLLKGGLQLSRSPNLLSYKTLFRLSGLSTSHSYELALASQYYTDNRSTSYRVGLVLDTVENGGSDIDWRAGLNYALLGNLIPNSAGEIHVQAKINSAWAPLNGWQLLDKGVRAAGSNAFTTIDTCSFGALGSAQVMDSTIALTVPYGTALGALTPTFVASAGAAISPTTPQNFVSPVIYRVTAENGVSFQDYTATITVAPNVAFATSSLPVTSGATGTNILNTGILIAANHFGNAGDGLVAASSLTLSNGLTFGTSTAHLGSGWSGHATASWASSASIADAPYKTLMSCVFWIAWGDSVSTMTFPGLAPGHDYRLQMISVEPNSCKVSIGGSVPATWSGNNTLMTATWRQPAGRTDMDVVLSRASGQGEIKFNGYALHQVDAPALPSSTTLASSLGAAGVYGTPATFTATVAVTGGPATGTVTFRDGAAVAGTGTLSSGQATYTSSALAVGSHSITASYEGDASFEPSLSGAFSYTVSAKALTITGLAASNKEYDGTPTATLTGGTLRSAEAVGSGTADDGAPYSGDEVLLNLSGSFATKDKGTGIAVTSTSTLSGAQAGHYSLTQPAGLTGAITARTLTVTASDQSKTYGQTLLFGSGSTQFFSSGLQNGETIGSVTLSCSGGGAAAAVSPYPITPSAATGGTFDANNYTISYVDGTLSVSTVNKKLLAEDFEHEWADNALVNTTNGWTSSGSADLSSVTNPPAGYAALAGGVPFPLAYDHAGQKRMLKLNTQGDTLTTPGTDEGFANDKVYVDMMVNFTVGETLPAAPSADADVKAAVYLKAEGASTNLYVFHGQKGADGFGEPVFSVATNGTAIVPGTWYRLTVVLESLAAEGGAVEMFRVLINGQALLSTNQAYGDNWKTSVFTSPYTPDGGSWFLSAARRSGTAGPNYDSIGNLAFQGTGLIDDLVVTDKEPSFVYGTVFMLTLSDGHWQGGGRRW
ncbi:MAG: DUF6288 domain-containing protein [bacterium]